MEIFSWMSNEVALAVLGLGLPGLIFIMFVVYAWHTGRIMARYERESASRDKERAADRERYDKERADERMRYDKDMTEVRQMYTNNVSLVKRYADISDNLVGTIHLNTQTLTRLVEKVNNNMFCPQVREKGPNRP